MSNIKWIRFDVTLSSSSIIIRVLGTSNDYGILPYLCFGDETSAHVLLCKPTSHSICNFVNNRHRTYKSLTFVPSLGVRVSEINARATPEMYKPPWGGGTDSAEPRHVKRITLHNDAEAIENYWNRTGRTSTMSGYWNCTPGNHIVSLRTPLAIRSGVPLYTLPIPLYGLVFPNDSA